MKKLILLIITIIAPIVLPAQNYIITSAVPQIMCTGSTVYIPFKAYGNYNPANEFRLEISNEYGVFTNYIYGGGPYIDSCDFHIPLTYLIGQQYRFRVRSTDPVVIGSDNGSDITIQKPPQAIAQAVTTTPLINSNLQLQGFGIGGTGNYTHYQWAATNGYYSTQQNPVIQNVQLSNSGAYRVRVMDDAGCLSVYSPPLAVHVTNFPLTVQQPQSININAGVTAYFIAGTNVNSIKQWLKSEDHGLSWSTLSNSSIYHGVNSDTLSITGTSYYMTGHQFKCNMNIPGTGIISSNAATLSIHNSTVITWVDSIKHCTGNPTQIEVPVYVSNLHDVSAISLGIRYADSALQYVTYYNLQPQLTQNGFFGINAMAVPNSNMRELRISWFGNPGSFIGFKDSTILLTLVFDITGEETGLNFNLANGVCEYMFMNFNIPPAEYINGNMRSAPCRDVEGILSYLNPGQTVIGNTQIKLKRNGHVLDSATTNATGYYHFSDVQDGYYQVEMNTQLPWGGANSLDALKCLQHFVGLSILTGLNKTVADVDNSGIPAAIDGLYILQRFTGMITSFPMADWIISPHNITVGGSNATQVLNISTLCAGDVNGSYFP